MNEKDKISAIEDLCDAGDIRHAIYALIDLARKQADRLKALEERLPHEHKFDASGWCPCGAHTSDVPN